MAESYYAWHCKNCDSIGVAEEGVTPTCRCNLEGNDAGDREIIGQGSKEACENQLFAYSKEKTRPTAAQ